MPKWLATVDSLSPVKALGLGIAVLAAVNPKNLILTAGAAAGLAQVSGLTTTDAVVAIAVFVVIANFTIAGPVIYSLVGGTKAKASLDSAKTWLTAHNAAVMAVLLLVFGVDLIAKGLPPLTHLQPPQSTCSRRRFYFGLIRGRYLSSYLDKVRSGDRVPPRRRSGVSPYLQLVHQVRQALRLACSGKAISCRQSRKWWPGWRSTRTPSEGVPGAGARGPGQRPPRGVRSSPGPLSGRRWRRRPAPPALQRWLVKARRAGLDEESIEALFREPFRPPAQEDIA